MSDLSNNPEAVRIVAEHLEIYRREVLREAAAHLRRCAKEWDGGTLGRAPILRHNWRKSLRNGVGFAAMELDKLARQEDQ